MTCFSLARLCLHLELGQNGSMCRFYWVVINTLSVPSQQQSSEKSDHCMQMITNFIVRIIREQSNALFYSLVLYIQC